MKQNLIFFEILITMKMIRIIYIYIYICMYKKGKTIVMKHTFIWNNTLHCMYISIGHTYANNTIFKHSGHYTWSKLILVWQSLYVDHLCIISSTSCFHNGSLCLYVRKFNIVLYKYNPIIAPVGFLCSLHDKNKRSGHVPWIIQWGWKLHHIYTWIIHG